MREKDRDNIEYRKIKEREKEREKERKREREKGRKSFLRLKWLFLLCLDKWLKVKSPVSDRQIHLKYFF